MIASLEPSGALALLGFDLLRPTLAVALALVPLVLVAGLLEHVGRRRRRAALADPGLVERVVAERSRVKGGVKLAAELIGLALVVLALLGPTRGFTLQPVEQRSLDLVVCIDTSRSMLAEDVGPNRLERAKREVRGLLNELAGDRVGLLAFSGDVREVAPLTRDTAALEGLLDEALPEANRFGGTNLGAALERALEIFDGRTGANEAIIVLTDGEDLEGRGREVAERAQSQGIRVFVVGVGTPDGAKIPVEDGRGGVSFLRDSEGVEVVSRLDRDSLDAIAEVSGGAFLTTSDVATPLEEIYTKRIAQLGGTSTRSGEVRVPNDRYQWALMPGLACLLLAFGLGQRRYLARRSRPVGFGAPGAGGARSWLVGLPLAAVLALGAPGTARAAVEGQAGTNAEPGGAALGLDVETAGLRELLDAALASLEDGRSFEAYLLLTRALGEPDPLDGVDADQLTAAGMDPALVDEVLDALDAASGSSAEDEAAAESSTDGVTPAEPTGEVEPDDDIAPRWTDTQAAHLWLARALAGRGLALEQSDMVAASRQAAPVSTGGVFEARLAVEATPAAEQAIADYRRAAGLTEAPAVRRHALASAGALALEVAEARRAFALAALDAPTPMPEAPPGPDPAAERDAQRALYLEARALLLDAWRADPVATTTRANLELVVRRLRQLDEEDQEEEEQPEDESDEGEDESEDSEDSEESEEEDEGEEESESEEESQEEGSEDESEENDPEQENPEQDPDQEPEEGDEDPFDEVEQEPEVAPEDQEPIEPSTPDEELPPLEDVGELSDEELSRFLDRLRELEAEQETMRRALNKARRKPTDRDW